MKIQVYEKNVYGNELLYPACEIAKKFAVLLGVKTFNHKQINCIKDLGYKIELVSKTGDL